MLTESQQQIYNHILKEEFEEAKNKFKTLEKTEKDFLIEYLKVKTGTQNQILYTRFDGYQYTGFNLFCLMLFGDPGKYGTLVQWKTQKKSIKPGSKAIVLQMPVFDNIKATEPTIKFWKKLFVFHESQTL